MCFNQVRYVKEALRSVFRQTYQPLEIVVSDDASTDGSQKIIEQCLNEYQGPHQVTLNFNSKNMCERHLDQIMDMSRGDILIQGHADDVFFPDRTRRLVEVFDRTGADQVTSNAVRVDADGKELGLWFDGDQEHDVSLDAYSRHYSVATCFGAAMAWTRALYEAFGPLPVGPRQMDIIYAFRGALRNGGVFLNEPLLYYRDHGHNASIWAMLKAAKTKTERALIQERDLCNKVANVARMLDDVLDRVERHPDDEVAQQVVAALYQRLHKISTDWTVLRRELARRKVGLF